MFKLNLRRHLERTLATTLSLAFFLPLLLTVTRHWPIQSGVSLKISRWLDRNRLGIPDLEGVITSMPKVPFSFRAVMSDEFQKRKAWEFNEHFAGREGLIRYTNEIWFRVFREAANPPIGIEIGKNDVLYGTDYLSEYFVSRIGKPTLEPWVKDLRRFQDFCRTMGMGFSIVLSPGKSSIYPEDVPPYWRRYYDPHPRVHTLLTELFRENGIVFVDGVDLVAEEKLKNPPAPLFPKGGVHWNERATFIVANAIQAKLVKQNKPVHLLEVAETSVSYEPRGDENDFLSLLNLVHTWRYPCERFTIKQKPSSTPLNLVAVGTSFSWGFLRPLYASGQFSTINAFFYYKTYKTIEMPGNYEKIVRQPTGNVDFNREIFAADCLLLEINEANAVFPEHFLRSFITDALAHLPDPAGPRPPYQAK